MGERHFDFFGRDQALVSESSSGCRIQLPGLAEHVFPHSISKDAGCNDQDFSMEQPRELLFGGNQFEQTNSGFGFELREYLDWSAGPPLQFRKPKYSVLDGELP